ncbi:MAG: hypothetical protein SF052_11970 [Bacteroidia bacterium]|nr:hypothetical protein [Bacteroidia bacterium]
MTKAGICLISSFVFFIMPVPAQTLQVEGFISGGGNLSKVQSINDGFWQEPFPTLFIQGNVGYSISRRLGGGVGLTYYPIGIRRRFFPNEIRELDRPFYSANITATRYHFMPHFYTWYVFPENGRHFFSASQLSLGLLYAKWTSTIGFFKTYETELNDGQILRWQTESVVIPHTFLAIESRWDVRILHSKRHGLFGVLHVIKGINPIRTTTGTYSVGNASFKDQSKWVTYGDYLGLGVAYKWNWGKIW